MTLPISISDIPRCFIAPPSSVDIRDIGAMLCMVRRKGRSLRCMIVELQDVWYFGLDGSMAWLVSFIQYRANGLGFQIRIHFVTDKAENSMCITTKSKSSNHLAREMCLFVYLLQPHTKHRSTKKLRSIV